MKSMRPINLAETKGFSVEHTRRSLVYEIPREGGMTACVELPLSELAKFASFAIKGAATIKNAPALDGPPGNDAKRTISLSSTEINVIGHRDPDGGFLVFRCGAVDIQMSVRSPEFEVLRQLLARPT